MYRVAHKGGALTGPKADLKLRMLDARISPVSGHYQLDQSCPESAIVLKMASSSVVGRTAGKIVGQHEALIAVCNRLRF
jgi:hypothetical protein